MRKTEWPKNYQSFLSYKKYIFFYFRYLENESIPLPSNNKLQNWSCHDQQYFSSLGYWSKILQAFYTLVLPHLLYQIPNCTNVLTYIRAQMIILFDHQNKFEKTKSRLASLSINFPYFTAEILIYEKWYFLTNRNCSFAYFHRL